MIYVLDQNNQPLMPTTRHGKVRRMLRDGLAKVVRRCPFTIKLLYPSGHIVQQLTLGVDTGSSYFGSAVCSENGRVLYASTTMLRTDIKTKMEARRENRSLRRCRKLRKRAARFLTRFPYTKKDILTKLQSAGEEISVKKLVKCKNGCEELKDVTEFRSYTKTQLAHLKRCLSSAPEVLPSSCHPRLSPTVRNKIEAHEHEISFVKRILPISRVVLEVGKFDPHAMKNPELRDTSDPDKRAFGYQHGELYGYENVKMYVRARDKYQCQRCKTKNGVLHVHHIQFRSQGGSDAPENLVTLCKDCHMKLHADYNCMSSKEFASMYGKLSKKTRNNSLSASTQMNSIGKRLLARVECAEETFGFMTKCQRTMLGIAKDHHLDACTIASGGKPIMVVKGMPVFLKRNIGAGSYKVCERPNSNGRTVKEASNLSKRAYRRFLKKRYEKYRKEFEKNEASRDPLKVKVRRHWIMVGVRWFTREKNYGFRTWCKVRYRGQIGFMSGQNGTGYLTDVFGKRLSVPPAYVNKGCDTVCNGAMKSGKVKLLSARHSTLCEQVIPDDFLHQVLVCAR